MTAEAKRGVTRGRRTHKHPIVVSFVGDTYEFITRVLGYGVLAIETAISIEPKCIPHALACA
jgi:hypothetical protein